MIERVELIRLEKSEEGTFGVLRLDGKVYCVTLEPPDKDNRENMSCIPAGQYGCRRTGSPRFGETFEIRDVPGRSHILFHPGNVQGDTKGCVLLGRHFGLLRGERAVLNSGRTFSEFMEQCEGGNVFSLTIKDACGEGTWTNFV